MIQTVKGPLSPEALETILVANPRRLLTLRPGSGRVRGPESVSAPRGARVSGRGGLLTPEPWNTDSWRAR
jgi:hypothetical protein